MDEIITIKRATKSDEPNANGYIYTKDAFDTAMYNRLKSGIPIIVSICPQELYTTLKREELVSKYSIGYVKSYDDDTISIVLDGHNKELVDKFLIPNKDKLVIMMRYLCNPDESKMITKITHISLFDIPIVGLPTIC